jgi:5'-nucleotidase/UDP-sugar diphosphatase
MRARLCCFTVFGLVVAACGSAGSVPSEARPTAQSLRLLYTADIHSHLLGEELSIRRADATHGLGSEGETAIVGGVARLATLLSEARADGVPTIYLDAGDLLEGTSFFPGFGGEPEVRVARALGTDAMAAGNHDLAFGSDALGVVLRKWARFPFLAANLPEEREAGLVQPVALIDRGGLRVAVIGLGRRPDLLPSLSACASAVAAAVSQVRAESNLVVVLSHLGRDADLALVPRTTGIDLVIGGHSHDVIDPPAFVLDCDGETAVEQGCEPRPVPVVHPGAYGRYLGRADLVLSSDVRDVSDFSGRAGERPSVVVEARFSAIPVKAPVPEQADVANLIAPYAAVLDAAGVNRPIGFAPETLSRRAPKRGDSALGNLVADALLESASADLATVNTTGIRADLLAGPVSVDDLVRVLPFSDGLVTLSLSGEDLLRAMRGAVTESCRSGGPSPFQIAGGRAVVNCARITLQLEVGGGPIEPQRIYRIAAPSFLTEAGRWLGLPFAEPPLATSDSVRDAVLDVLGERAACPERAENPLPCLVASADGRIVWD